MSRGDISFALLDYLRLDRCYSSEGQPQCIVNEMFKVGMSAGVYNSRCQLLDRLEHGLVEVAQSLPFQSTVEGSADLSTGQSKLNVIHLIDHRVLNSRISAFAIDQQQETHFDHCEDNAGGAKNSLGRRDTRKFLREIHGFDGRIQRRDSTFSLLRLLGFVCHGRKAK